MALLLDAITLSWTPPHFRALALVPRDEYADADVPMLPAVRGEGPTLRHILAYAALTVVLSALPVLAGKRGIAYAVAAAALGGVLLSVRPPATRSGRCAASSILLLHAALSGHALSGYAGGLLSWLIADKGQLGS